MIKKLTVLLLTFIFIVPTPNVLGASFFSDNELAAYSEDIRFLSTFDVVDLDDFEDQTKSLTRGEFASILISLHGLNDLAHSIDKETAFKDVPADHEYAEEINAAVQFGFMVGYSSDSFAPDEELLSEHAIVALVRSLGYGAVVDGSMQQYIAKATDISLTKNAEVSIGYPITRYNLVKLLLNAIDIDFLEGFERQEGTTYAVVAGKNIVSEVFHIESRRGTVTADKYSGLRTAGGTGSSTVLEIDGTRYTIPETERSWVGFYVDYYVDSNSPDTIRYIKQSNKNTEKELSTVDYDITYSDGVYSYSDKDTGRKHTLKLATGFAVIYNGAAPDSSANLTMAPVRGSVTLLDNGTGDGWNVVYIEDLTYCVAEIIDTREMRIYAKYGTQLDLSDTEFLKISDTNGKDMSIDDITSGNVILATVSQDGMVAKLNVSKQTISGEVKQIDVSAGEVYIDDKLYKLAPGLEHDDIRLGMKATFLLDRDGYIASFRTDGSDLKTGYLIRAYMADEAEDEEIYFKIFDFSLGDFRILSNKKKMTFDGTSRTPKDAYSYYSSLPRDENENVKVFPVVFEENEDKGITKLITPYGNNNGSESLNLITKSSDALYTQPQGGFYTSGVFPTSSSVIYAIPSDPRDADATEFKRLSTGSFTHDKRYSMEAYRIGDDSLYTDLLLVDRASGEFATIVPGVVMKISEELIPDLDEIATKVTVGMSGGNKDLLFFDEDFPLGSRTVPASFDGSPRKIAVGDVIEFARTDYHGYQRATDVSMVFSYDEYLKTGDGQLLGGGNIGASVTARHYVDGTVYDKDDNLIMLTTNDITGNKAPSQVEILNASRGNVYKIEGRAGKRQVEEASARDIIPYTVSGKNCSKIFYYAEWGWQHIFYIYE